MGCEERAGRVGGGAGDWRSAVAGAVDVLSAEELSGLPVAVLGDEAVGLLGAAEALRVEAVRRLTAFDAGRGWVGSGARSLGGWVAHRGPLGAGEARSLAGLARLAGRHGFVAEALESGRVGLAEARQVAAVVTPERVAAFERFGVPLVEGVARVERADVPTVVARWRAAADDWLADEGDGGGGDGGQEGRWASASVLPGGRVRFGGELDPVRGAALLAGVDDLMDPDPPDVAGGPRTARQRRADAFAELASRHLARRSAEAGPQAPGVGVDVQLGVADLLAGLGRICRCQAPHDGHTPGGPNGDGCTAGGPGCGAHVAAGHGLGGHRSGCPGVDGPTVASGDPALDPLVSISEVARIGPVARVVAARLACDAAVGRIVIAPDADELAALLGPDGPLAVLRDTPLGRRLLDAPGQPLDLGRRSRPFTAAQRRAIAARDRHCVAPGCDRPPEWCDVHHLDHWTAGGPTDLDNGVLLCRHHHTVAHLHRWRPHRRHDGTWALAPP